MTNRLILAALLLILSVNADAQYVSGNTLHELCRHNETEADFDPACVWFITGALDMYIALKYTTNVPEPAFCMPENAIRRQSVDVVRDYLENHPENRHFDAIVIILASMAIAFPCEADTTTDP